MALNDRILDADGTLISATVINFPSSVRNEDDALFRSRWVSEATCDRDVSALNETVFRAPDQLRRRTISSNPDDSP